MADMTYDIAKLNELAGINAESALKHFSGSQAYFDALSDFVDTSKHYLHGYTASVVIYSEDMRRAFLSEIESLRATVISLGIDRLLSALSDLDYASGSGSPETLADWLLRFHVEMGNLTKCIVSARTASAAGNAGKPVILAVDDKPELLTAIVNMLGDKFTVMAVTSGKAALKVIDRHTPSLFLLDIEMPQMDGYELAKMIRAHQRFESSPILFLTGKNTRFDVIMAIKNGGNDYLLKPVDKELLLDKIHHYMKPDM